MIQTWQEISSSRTADPESGGGACSASVQQRSRPRGAEGSWRGVEGGTVAGEGA